MESIDLYQIVLLSLQCVLVSVLILVLFRIRFILGISALYAAIGLFQYMQVFLASAIYIEIAKGIVVSPGSAVLFTASLFTVLLVYIKEDAIETRKIVYALLITNIIMSGLLYIFSWHIGNSNVYNPVEISSVFFKTNARVLLTGTLTLLLDSLLIIVLYEFISKLFSKVFLRIYLTMTLVLIVDTLIFCSFSFWDFENLKSIIISGIISKSGAVIIYSILFYIYLCFVEKETQGLSSSSFKDFFYALSYRQKLEIVEHEKELVKKDAEKAIQLSEIKYKTLINMSPVGIFLTATDGYTKYVNPKWCLISGLSLEQAIGWGWLDAVHPEDRIQIENGWKKATVRHVTSQAEYRFVHPDGTIKWVLGQAIPEKDNNDEIIGYIGTVTDITIIKNFEIELNNAKEKAEENDRLKSAFLQNISHEIRTPLNAICGFSSFLRDTGLSSEKKDDFVNIIQNSSDQLLAIMNDILTISSLETRQEKINQSTFCVNSILNELLEIFKQQSLKTELVFRVENGLSDENAQICTDKTKLTQILTNLLANAVKFTHEGQIVFGYVFKDGFLEFFVKDTGIGIAEESQEKVFERFNQADKKTHTYYGGTGLGLSISKGFVELLGGRIWVESELGKGSSFYFTIPHNQQCK